MRKLRVAVTAGLAAACTASAACSAAISPGALAGTAHGARESRHQAGAGHWRASLVLRQPPRLRIISQVVDPQARVDYALAVTSVRRELYRIRRTPLTGGPVRTGPVFGVWSIGLAGGYVWVYGSRPLARAAQALVLYQVDPGRLAVVRHWTLAVTGQGPGFVAVAASAGHTVFVGFQRTILRLNAVTGAIVARIRLRSGLWVSSLAVAPSGRYLDVAAENRDGATTITELSAATGQLLASTSGAPLSFSVGGSSVTAARGSVWASFRTGMLGQTVLLRQHGLGLVRLSGQGPPRGLFHWAMWASTGSAGRAVFLDEQGGAIACVDPATGRVRARGHFGLLANGGFFIGAAESGHVLYAETSAGVAAIIPPASCRA